MLAGVDGELARSSFHQTRFGAWPEMVRDYLKAVDRSAGRDEQHQLLSRSYTRKDPLRWTIWRSMSCVVMR